MLELKIGRHLYTITEDDRFLDNGACIQLTSQNKNSGGAWGFKESPTLSKSAEKKIDMFFRVKQSTYGSIVRFTLAKWRKSSELPDINSRKYYMVYAPHYTGHLFRCRRERGYWMAPGVQSVIDDDKVACYRIAGHREQDRQYTDEEKRELEGFMNDRSEWCPL